MYPLPTPETSATALHEGLKGRATGPRGNLYGAMSAQPGCLHTYNAPAVFRRVQLDDLQGHFPSRSFHGFYDSPSPPAMAKAPESCHVSVCPRDKFSIPCRLPSPLLLLMLLVLVEYCKAPAGKGE